MGMTASVTGQVHLEGVRLEPDPVFGAQGAGGRIGDRDVNRALTACAHDIFGWSMRPWESVRRRGTRPRGVVRHHHRGR
jgi:alkylation response protein AidB-like acyl-CoA dehydrogenase